MVRFRKITIQRNGEEIVRELRKNQQIMVSENLRKEKQFHGEDG